MTTMSAAAVSLQHPTLFPSRLQIASPSSLSSPQNLTLPRPSLLRWALSSKGLSITGLRFVPAAAAARVGVLEEDDDDDLSSYEEELGAEQEVEDEDDEEEIPSGSPNVRRTFRLLGNKEKKELRAYAHQLGNDICIHQVGKWGLTANCITAISDALEANELVKIRVLDNLDEELDDTASQLEAKTGAQIVGKVGRTLLLYRPSMRKLKATQAAEEKAFKYQKRKNLLASRGRSSRPTSGASRGKR